MLALYGLAVTVVTGCVPLGWQGQTPRVPVGIGLWALWPDLLYMFRCWLLVWEILYFATTSLIKMSPCLLFLRIFGRHNATARIPPCGVPFRPVAWATLATNAVMDAVFLVLCFTQCSPLSYTWTRWAACQTATALGTDVPELEQCCIRHRHGRLDDVHSAVTNPQDEHGPMEKGRRGCRVLPRNIVSLLCPVLLAFVLSFRHIADQKSTCSRFLTR